MYVESRTSPSLLLRMRDLNDHSAWETFVKIYGPLIYGYVRRRGLQHADAAEVTQEVLCQVSQSIGKFEYQPAKGKFRGWLGAIARSKVCQFQRRRRDSVQPDGDHVLDSAISPSGDPVWDEQFNQHLLHLAIRRIRPRFEEETWRAFELAWLDDESAEQVAQKLSCDVQFVYVAKSRVLKKLREEVCLLAENAAVIR